MAGLDTRVWQSKGSAGDVDGVVFSLAGEIVKVGGLQPLIKWKKEPPADGLPSEENNPFVETPKELGIAAQVQHTILELGSFVWGGTTEILIAHFRPDPPDSGFKRETADGGQVIISVLETNVIREIHSYRVSAGGPRPKFYPRFIDVGLYVLILVDGMRPVKWDGRMTTLVGIHEKPDAPQVSLLKGTADDGTATDDPEVAGSFWERHSLNQDDATGIRTKYYQTYINRYGQESNLSSPSNELTLNNLLGVSETEAISFQSSPQNMGLADSYQNLTAKLSAYDEWSANPNSSQYWINQSNSAGEYNDGSADLASNSVRDASSKDDRLVPFLRLGDQPRQLDIAKRSVYRSINGQVATALPRRLGVGESTHFDVRKLAESSVTPAPAPGENNPPPNARWAFPFRGRVYYRGASGSVLHYSKLSFPEAVSAANFIEVNTNDGDVLTAWGAAQDYVILFKRNSAYLLTHDKAEEPIITPLQSTFGAITDRAVASFDNNTYFLSDVGFHLFDGSSFKRLSVVLDQKVRLLPKHTRDTACVFVDKNQNRVYVSVNANPGIQNNEIWSIHTDTGAFTVIKDRKVAAAVSIKGEVVVASEGLKREPDLFMWDTGYDLSGKAYTGEFSTEWIELKSPHTDKRFYKLLLYFVQTGTISLRVDWYLDWDDRISRGNESVTLSDDDGAEWDDTSVYGVSPSTTVKWDDARLVSKFIDLHDESSTKVAQLLDAKSVRFKFTTTSETRTGYASEEEEAAGLADADGRISKLFEQTPFRLVGWQVLAQDFGERSEGSSDRG